MRVVYDAGLLVAADRNDRRVWADHRARLERGVVPMATAPVVAQISRSPRQAQLHRFLRGCHIVAFSAHEADEVGSLLARAGMADVVDAHVVITASPGPSIIFTSDLDDLVQLASRLPASIRVVRI